MKIFLIRHGQTDWNLEERFQGREDIPLNENGLIQAKECGMALAGEEFGAVITSPLSRTRRTAEIIAGAVSLDRVIIEDRLIERDFSKISGMTPAQREIFYQSGEKDDKEPWNILCDRMLSCMKDYGELYPQQNVIMVSHGASINAVLFVLSSGETGTGKLVLKNTCINIIDYHKGNLTLEEYNLTPQEYQTRKIGRRME